MRVRITGGKAHDHPRGLGLALTTVALCGLMGLLVTRLVSGREHVHLPLRVRSRQRKIILMTIDALRADRLGCYGYRRAETSPTIDAWAGQAVLFEHAYAQAPWTIPSLASLMSGRDAREVGAHTNLLGDIRSPEKTLAEQLRQLGYRTAFVNTNPLLLRPGMARGFDSVAPPSTNGAKLPYTAVEPLVMEWLDQHARDQFFLWIHDMDTHSPPTDGNPYLARPGWNSYDAEVRWVDEAVGRLFAKLDALGIRDQVLFIFTADHGEAFGEHHLDGHQDVIYDEVLHVPLIVRYPGMVRTGRVADPVQLLDVNPTIAELAGARQPPVSRGESLVPITATNWFSWAARPQHPYVFSARYYFGTDRSDPVSGKVLTARGTHQLAVHSGRWKMIAKVPATLIPPLIGDGVEGDSYEQPDWDTTNPAATAYELYDLSTDPLEQQDVFAAQPQVGARLQHALVAWKQMTDGGYRATARARIIPAAIDSATREAMHALGYE